MYRNNILGIVGSIFLELKEGALKLICADVDITGCPHIL
jgi:hypothetical protein